MAKSRETVRVLLAKPGMPLEKLAKALGVPRYTLFRLKTNPPLNPWGQTLKRIADGLTKCGVPCTVERVVAAIEATRAAAKR